MPPSKPRILLRIEYDEAAQAYLHSLPLEHFTEATDHAKQREITLESLDLVTARRPDVRVFNELLVQYPLPDGTIGQVVPDNMVVLHDGPLEAEGSYNVPLEAARPFWTLEYVSKHNKRKDYEDNFRKYERELKVPYYLLFYPDAQELTLFQLRGRKYRSVQPNEQGRYAIADVDLEMAVLDDWVRYWYQGELLPLPADLQRDLDETRQQLRRMTRRARTLQRRAQEQAQRAQEQAQRADAEQQARRTAELELERLRAELERLKNSRGGNSHGRR